MLKSKFAFFFLGVALMLSCGQNEPAKNNADTVAPKANIPISNYIDFKYSKVIAFATVDPMDSPNLQKGNAFPGFHDTISRTLDSLQILALNDVLSGRKGIAPDSAAVADCFYPRHNIVFLDNAGHVLHYLAICFECNRRKASKSTPASMESLAALFNSIGLPVFDRPDWHSQYYDSIAKKK